MSLYLKAILFVFVHAPVSLSLPALIYNLCLVYYSAMLYTDIMRTEKNVRIDARLKESEKDKLLKLAKSKGCEGITAFLRLLVKAKKIDIKL